MSSDKTYFSPLRSTEMILYRQLGKKLQGHSITISPTSEGFITTKYNIFELSKNTKTVIHTYTLSSNFQTLEYVFKMLVTLIEDYTNNGKTDGNTVYQTSNRLEAQERTYSHMY